LRIFFANYYFVQNLSIGSPRAKSHLLPQPKPPNTILKTGRKQRSKTTTTNFTVETNLLMIFNSRIKPGPHEVFSRTASLAQLGLD